MSDFLSKNTLIDLRIINLQNFLEQIILLHEPEY